MKKGLYRIGELARKGNVSIRCIRYYEELGLLKAKGRDKGAQRYYSDNDLVYIRRILELKALGFSLEEIKRITTLNASDSTGELRRVELLGQYRMKLSSSLERKSQIEAHINELEWHIRQLEGASSSFQDCPGPRCQSCAFRSRCQFSITGKDT